MILADHRLFDRDRAKSLFGVAALHALIGYALMLGLHPQLGRAAMDGLKTFDVAELPPPAAERPKPKPSSDPRREGAASPPNLEAVPKPVTAPQPKIMLPPPPMVAAPIAAEGAASSAGAAQVPGPGTGSGGIGNGTGSGGWGDGPGGGGPAVPARWLKGRIKDSDYPRAAAEARIQGNVVAAFTIGTNGRTRDCRILESSGNAELDATTCSVILKRFVFAPARDAAGRPVPDTMQWKALWWLQPRG